MDKSKYTGIELLINSHTKYSWRVHKIYYAELVLIKSNIKWPCYVVIGFMVLYVNIIYLISTKNILFIRLISIWYFHMFATFHNTYNET